MLSAHGPGVPGQGAEELDALLGRACRGAGSDPVFPGCVALVWRAGQRPWCRAYGTLASEGPSSGRPTTPDTRYDLASLTKVLATTTLCAQALAQGVLSLDEPIPEALALTYAADPAGLESARRPQLRALLEHAAGLVAHREFFHAPWSLRPGQPRALIDAVRAEAPAAAPGTRSIYSDLGFILLGAWLERRLGASLDQLFRERIAEPLGIDAEVGFASLTARRTPDPTLEFTAPTERYDDPSRHWAELRTEVGQPLAHGVVHDDNCVVMGGVAGHAGLFGTAHAVATIAQAWLDRRLPGVPPDRSEEIWATFSRPSLVPGSSRRLGFDGPSPGGSTGGALSSGAIGHLGFTGSSLWIDPMTRAVYILLSNRVHPDRASSAAGIRRLRVAFHRQAALLRS